MVRHAPTLPASSGNDGGDERDRPVDLVGLTAVMARERGRPEVVVAVLDGPVATDHPALSGALVTPVPSGAATCADDHGFACAHGTAVAGILVGARDAGTFFQCQNNSPAPVGSGNSAG